MKGTIDLLEAVFFFMLELRIQYFEYAPSGKEVRISVGVATQNPKVNLCSRLL